MLGERRRDVRLAFLRQLDPLVAGDVRVDRVEVERLREHGARLADRLALVARVGERGDERGDVVDRELVDAAAAEVRRDLEDPADRRAVHVPRLLVDVDAATRASASAASASVGSFAGSARTSVRSGIRAGRRVRRSTKPARIVASRFVLKLPPWRLRSSRPPSSVLDEVSRLAVLRRARPDPDASHGRPRVLVVGSFSRSAPPGVSVESRRAPLPRPRRGALSERRAEPYSLTVGLGAVAAVRRLLDELEVVLAADVRRASSRAETRRRQLAEDRVDRAALPAELARGPCARAPRPGARAARRLSVERSRSAIPFDDVTLELGDSARQSVQTLRQVISTRVGSIFSSQVFPRPL